MNKIDLFHGSILVSEFPEHLDWFLPDFFNALNTFLANFDSSITISKIDYFHLLSNIN
jgi:hypothetical protein